MIEKQKIIKEFSWDDAKPHMITPVKDQGRCGSSYAFTVIGAMEALHSMQNLRDATQLSE
jgi:C1A family cysteine protease